MSEYRQDPHAGGWVLVAPQRGDRPGKHGWAHTHADAARPDTPCPFCAGNEHLLPDIIEEAPCADVPGWRTRVVPNKYPAVATEAGARSDAGFGRHEVIVETPRHDAAFHDFSDAELDAVLRTYRARYVALAALSRTRQVVLFRNSGRRAGASLSHPHAQIVSMDRMAPRLKRIATAAREHHRRHGCCATCREVEDLLANRERLVRESPHFVLAVPHAAAGPFELALMPKRHAASFGDIGDRELSELGELLRWAASRLHAQLEAPPWNMMLDSLEADARSAAALHWRIAIVPRLTNRGGFELATGLAINPSSPERDAARLRDGPT